MPGPCSTPNGDTRLMAGHVDEEFVCVKHFRKFDDCGKNCVEVSLRSYLSKRNILETGKTFMKRR